MLLFSCTANSQGWFLFSYLYDFSYFPLKIVFRNLVDTVRTYQKWSAILKGDVDGFIYFSLISVISFLYPRFPEEGGGGVYCFTSVRLSIRLRYFSSHFSHIVGSVFGPIRFLLPVSWLCSFLYTLNIYAHFSSHFSQQLLMAEIWYFVASFI